MFPVTLQKFLVFLVLAFYKHFIKACDDTVITSCRSDSSCIQTYGQLYNALASNKNHFNISEALYPAKRPPSVLVRVTLFGDNEIGNCCTVTYTWSTSCLYAAFPSFVLEILSFGSILVYHRTQDLAITIPPFCCNVSVDDRMTMIDKGLASFQDLAVSPGIQDPRLNNPVCVNRGNEPKLPETATRITYILGTIFSSLLFTIFLGLWLAIFTLVVLNRQHKLDFKDDKSSLATIKAVKLVSVAMLVVELVLFVLVFLFSACGNASWFIYVAPAVSLFVGLIIGIRFDKDILAKGNEDTLLKGKEDALLKGNEDTLLKGNEDTLLKGKEDALLKGKEDALMEDNETTLLNEDTLVGESTRDSKNVWPNKENKLSRLLIISTFIWAFLTSYHISWLVVGIMVNAIWGITVLFFFCLIIVVSIFITYSCFKSRPSFVTFLFLSLSFVAMVIFTGPPGFGSSTADDVVKIVIVPIATGIIPLIFHLFADKKENGKSNDKNKGKEEVVEESEQRQVTSQV